MNKLNHYLSFSITDLYLRHEPFRGKWPKMKESRTDSYLKRTCRRLESRGCVAGGCLRGRGCRCWGSGLGALLRGFLFLHPWKLMGQGRATRQRDRALLVLRRRCRLCPELEAIRGSSLLAPRSRHLLLR